MWAWAGCSFLMSLPTQMQRDSDAEYDTRVARAIDRVLEAERAAQSAIGECEKQTQESLEHARQQRRSILERAQKLIVALHTRAARTFDRQAAQIHQQPGKTVPGAAAQQADRARPLAAIERLADRLIGVGNEEI